MTEIKFVKVGDGKTLQYRQNADFHMFRPSGDEVRCDVTRKVASFTDISFTNGY